MRQSKINRYDLATIDRVLSRSYNVNFRLLNLNGWEMFCDIWSNNFPTELAELEQIIKQKEVFTDENKLILNNDLLDRIEQPHICKLLTGSNSYQKNITEKQERKFYNKKILASIFKVMPDGIDPFYSELENFYPIIKPLYRFYYLQLLYRIGHDEFNYSNLLHPIGYHEVVVDIFKKGQMFNDNSGVVIIISGIWIRPEEFISVEKKYFCCHRNRLCTEVRLRTIIYNLENKYKTKLSFDEEQYILGQCLQYQVMSQECVQHIIDFSKISFYNIFELFFDTDQRNQYESLGNEEKFRLLSSIPTLISSHCKNLFNRYCYHPIEIKRTFWERIISKPSFEIRSKFNIEIHFSLAKAGNSILVLKADLSNYHNTISLSIDRDHNTRTVKVFIDGIENETIESEVYWLIGKSHREDISKMQAREKSILSYFKHEFERLPTDPNTWDIDQKQPPKQICLTLRHAKRLVLADFALYFQYDGINRIISCRDVIRNEFLLEHVSVDSSEQYQWEDSIIKKIQNLNVYEQPNKYKSCESIRDEKIISKFFWSNDKVDYKIDECTLFANEIDTIYDTGKTIDGIPEKDHVIIPIIAHNRKLGVLYLASTHAEHFKYFDRTRLINFSKEIGVEIFEAKMIATFQKLNHHLGESIEGRLKENDFLDKLAEEVVNLLGSEGAIILWTQSQNTTHYQVAGRAGILKNYFGNKYLVAADSNIWGNTSSNVEFISIQLGNSLEEDNLKSMGYKSYIKVYMNTQRFNGIITLFDFKNQCKVTPSLKEELRLLGLEVERVLIRYFVNQGTLNSIRSYLGHDLTSILGAIDGACNHLDKIKVENLHDRSIYNRRVEDIRGYVDYGNDLLDFFLQNLHDEDITKTFEKGKGVPAFVSKLKKELSKPNARISKFDDSEDLRFNSIYEIILSVLQSKNLFSELKRNRNNIPVLTGKLKDIPDLWIHKDAFRQVVNNLLDNFEKYRIPNSELNISLRDSITGWHIVFENFGLPLSKFYEENTDELFGYGERFRKDKKGQGLGLFISKEIITEFGGSLDLSYFRIEKQNKASFSFIVFIPYWLKIEENKIQNIWHK